MTQAASMNGSNLQSLTAASDVQRVETTINHLWIGDARDMDACIAAEPGAATRAGNSVASAVTAPPCFAGKDYAIELGKGGVP